MPTTENIWTPRPSIAADNVRTLGDSLVMYTVCDSRNPLKCKVGIRLLREELSRHPSRYTRLGAALAEYRRARVSWVRTLSIAESQPVSVTPQKTAYEGPTDGFSKFIFVRIDYQEKSICCPSRGLPPTGTVLEESLRFPYMGGGCLARAWEPNKPQSQSDPEGSWTSLLFTSDKPQRWSPSAHPGPQRAYSCSI